MDAKAYIQGLVDKVATTFVVDRLDFLAKGGRCSSVVALGANLLKLKPCIVLADGKMSVGKKYRGTFEKILPDFIKDRLAGDGYRKDRCYLVYAACKDETIASLKELVESYGFGEVLVAEAGCTISSHCGPGTVGFVLLRK